MMGTKRLYDEDFVLWSKQQVEALRAAAHSGSNQQLDWDHLAEEIEGLGNSLRSASHRGRNATCCRTRPQGSWRIRRDRPIGRTVPTTGIFQRRAGSGRLVRWGPPGL